VQVKEADTLDGCSPLDATDAAAVNGKIAFVEWTDVDADRRCGSAGRAANLSDAGAIGFIYADDEEHFAAGITGSADIPGVLVAKSGGDRHPRRAGGRSHGATSAAPRRTACRPSTRRSTTPWPASPRAASAMPGDVKPDITAVGDSVFSAGSGTGNEGLNDSAPRWPRR